MFQKGFRERIHSHLGADPSGLPVITEEFPDYNIPNLHLAMEEFTSSNGREVEILGIQGGMNFLNFGGVTMTELIAKRSFISYFGFGGVKGGPVRRTTVDLEDGKSLRCIETALFLIKDGKGNLAVLVKKPEMDFSGKGDINLEVMAKEQSECENFIDEIKALMTKRNVYRGKLLSLSQTSPNGGGAKILFHTLPSVTRDDIILPDGLLKRIERQTMDVVQYSSAMLNAGQKLKRGILLHGVPGTGKTLCAKYLATQMKGRTVLMLTGRSQGLIESSCDIARWLQPSMVVIEDVDLIAEDRDSSKECSTPVLFELMNQMDGLTDDCDVLFLLTTNRPEILEPALSARPGRVDQAYEVPLPDEECRKLLFELYSSKLKIDDKLIEKYAKRTSGASGAFIAELIRKSALFAAPEGEPIKVEDKHLDEAMQELVFVGGDLTKRLLGFEVSEKEFPE